jgi:proteasome beta subunit
MDEELKKNILKTGTSILGIVCKDGVVMAADRRATVGNLIWSRNTQKAVQINEYLVFSGTGTASDVDMLKKIVAAELRLKELKSKQRPTVKDAANLISMLAYRNIRTPAMIPFIAGSLLAGFNEDGSTELFTIEPAGSVMRVDDYDANLSSGMPFILGLLERQWRKDVTIKDGVQLAVEALKSSTQRDSASGSGIDVFTITKDGIKQVVEQTIEPMYKDKK